MAGMRKDGGTSSEIAGIMSRLFEVSSMMLVKPPEPMDR